MALTNAAAAAPEGQLYYRSLYPGDLTFLKGIHSALFPIDYEEDFFLKVIHSLDRVFSFAAALSKPDGSEEVIGFITARIVFLGECDPVDRQVMGLHEQQMDHLPTVYILTLGVVEGHRQRGIARVLLELVHQHAVKLGCIVLFLHVISYNNAATRLYASHNFMCAARLDRFYYISTSRRPYTYQYHYDAFLYMLNLQHPKSYGLPQKDLMGNAAAVWAEQTPQPAQPAASKAVNIPGASTSSRAWAPSASGHGDGGHNSSIWGSISSWLSWPMQQMIGELGHCMGWAHGGMPHSLDHVGQNAVLPSPPAHMDYRGGYGGLPLQQGVLPALMKPPHGSQQSAMLANHDMASKLHGSTDQWPNDLSRSRNMDEDSVSTTRATRRDIGPGYQRSPETSSASGAHQHSSGPISYDTNYASAGQHMQGQDRAMQRASSSQSCSTPRDMAAPWMDEIPGMTWTPAPQQSQHQYHHQQEQQDQHQYQQQQQQQQHHRQHHQLQQQQQQQLQDIMDNDHTSYPPPPSVPPERCTFLSFNTAKTGQAHSSGQGHGAAVQACPAQVGGQASGPGQDQETARQAMPSQIGRSTLQTASASGGPESISMLQWMFGVRGTSNH